MAPKRDDFKDFVLDQLTDLRSVICRGMFGGYGLYCRDRFFGIIHKSRLYFKVTDGTRSQYQSHGMSPFRPNAKQTLTSFYEVPVEIIEQAEALVEWATNAVSAASAGATTRGHQGRTARRPAMRRRRDG